MSRQTKSPARPPADREGALTEVRAVYEMLETRPLHRDCQNRAACCHFRQTGKIPHLTRGEAWELARGLRAAGRTRLPERTDGACPLLGPNHLCLVYSSRPFGCRTHFCTAAGGPATRRDVLDLIRRLETVDERLGGDGPKPLPQALLEALTPGPAQRSRQPRSRP